MMRLIVRPTSKWGRYRLIGDNAKATGRHLMI